MKTINSYTSDIENRICCGLGEIKSMDKLTHCIRADMVPEVELDDKANIAGDQGILEMKHMKGGPHPFRFQSFPGLSAAA